MAEQPTRRGAGEGEGGSAGDVLTAAEDRGDGELHHIHAPVALLEGPAAGLLQRLSCSGYLAWWGGVVERWGLELSVVGVGLAELVAVVAVWTAMKMMPPDRPGWTAAWSEKHQVCMLCYAAASVRPSVCLSLSLPRSLFLLALFRALPLPVRFVLPFSSTQVLRAVPSPAVPLPVRVAGCGEQQQNVGTPSCAAKTVYRRLWTPRQLL
jgi:hypothetical protein